MSDLVNMHISKAAKDVADQMVNTGLFVHASTAAKFALAYAIKNHFDEIDPATYPIPESDGSTNYSQGTIDPDGQIAALLKALYPGITTPYFYARALMVFGLLKLGERIDREGLNSISALL